MEILFKYLFLILFILNVFIRYYSHWKINNNNDIGNENCFHFILKRFLVIIFCIISARYIISPQLINFNLFQVNNLIRFLAFIFGIILTIIHYWSFKTLNKYYFPTLKLARKHKLIKSGPYKLIRHPIYSTTIFGTFSLSIISNNFILFILSVIIFIGIWFFRIPKEEEMMINEFGKDYINYIKQTGKLFPNIKRILRG
tara:strand:- start:58 stop:654 length:597 start_codon:yes stop_codon:yes gene_type:complete